jgi:crotonobetainyl-CoA:carnitine CoA-transferase CaiB-like acyl-CoA transferase
MAGIRVLEMGSYTTAPLAARNLGALGAYVVKIEPPAGELSRASPPYSDGQSYFCTLSNSDKRSVAIDLRTGEGRTLFRDLLSKADVFVENMKPGVLGRFGFSPNEIASISPRMVYCSVSGYGASSPLADLPAMDTTIQGMAGIMDLTRGGGVPFKTGISISDLLGGQFALVAILAGLEYRERTGKGQFIDLSMQELSAWLTQFHWNSEADGVPDGGLLRCRDGFAYVMGDPETIATLEARYADTAKVDVAARLNAQGLHCVPVNTVSEVASHAHTAARELIVRCPSLNGKVWPLLASPIRITPGMPVVRRAMGAVGADLQEVLDDWGLQARAAVQAPG